MHGVMGKLERGWGEMHIKPRLAEDVRMQTLRRELRRRMRAYVTGAYLEHLKDN